MIAPYWADVDTRAAGNVYYKNSVSRNELNRAGRLISSTYRTHFRPTSLYIVTWYHVGAFSRSRSPVCFMFIAHINSETLHLLANHNTATFSQTQDVNPSAQDF